MHRFTVGNPIRHSVAARIGALVFAAGVAACSSSLPTTSTPVTPPPSDGWLTVQLTTPRSDDGAVQFQVNGPTIDSAVVTGYDGLATVTNGSADFIVTGSITSGTVALIHVRDVARSGEYRGSVVAAAARGTYATQDVTNYRTTLVR